MRVARARHKVTALVCLALAAIAALWSLSGGNSPPASSQTSILHRGNDSDPETLDPHKTSTVAEANILRDLYEGLVIHDAAGEVAPGVAESWSVSDDGLVYVFRLRGDARWSNGDAVTAQDFVFSLRRLMAPETGAKYAPVLYPIFNAEKVHKGLDGAKPEALGVRAVGTFMLEIRLEKPTAYFLELMTSQTALPVHGGSIKRFGQDWVKPGNMVSNGAYVLKSFVPNGSIALEKNAKFHDAPHVAIEEVRYYPTQDSAAAARRFMAGELHITSDVPVDQLDRLRAKLGEQVRIAPYIGTNFLVLNTAKAPFNDRRVRRALALAIDREFLATDIWAETMLPAYGMVPPGIRNYPRRVEADFAAASPIEREEEAIALLAAAGFDRERPLQVELRYNMTDNNQRTMVAIADQWNRIGVKTRFVHTDAKTHFAYLRDGGDFDAARYGWIADYADAQNFLFLLETGNDGLNVGKYSNPAFDMAMRAAAGETDAARRNGFLREAERIFVTELPWIPVMFYLSKALVSSRVEGYLPNAQAAHATRYMRLKP
jgi:oligopeptide transport system substrate-binding protein